MFACKSMSEKYLPMLTGKSSAAIKKRKIEFGHEYKFTHVLLSRINIALDKV